MKQLLFAPRCLLLTLVACSACARSAEPQQTAAAAPLPVASAAAPAPPPTPSAEPTAAASAAPSPGSSAEATPTKNTGSPKWTQIEGVRACTGHMLKMYVCAPDKRPPDCSEKAFKELTALTTAPEARNHVTRCALEPDITACSATYPGEPDGRCWPDKRPATCSDDKWARVKDVNLVYPCKKPPAALRVPRDFPTEAN